MNKDTLQKSSFTLPPLEAAVVTRLKKRLKLNSNTAVIRYALSELEKNFDRENLRKKFLEASQLVRKANKVDMEELDLLSDEGIE